MDFVQGTLRLCVSLCALCTFTKVPHVSISICALSLTNYVAATLLRMVHCILILMFPTTPLHRRICWPNLQKFRHACLPSIILTPYCCMRSALIEILCVQQKCKMRTSSHEIRCLIFCLESMCIPPAKYAHHPSLVGFVSSGHSVQNEKYNW